jgi:hypothetical protein
MQGGPRTFLSESRQCLHGIHLLREDKESEWQRTTRKYHLKASYISRPNNVSVKPAPLDSMFLFPRGPAPAPDDDPDECGA